MDMAQERISNWTSGILHLSNLGLWNLPNNLPQGLKTLYCCGNLITSLDNLPQGLTQLGCCGNLITSLDNLPQGLKTLYCGRNQITSLNNLPQGLTYIGCCGNQITSLDNLPQGLAHLYCSGNKLIKIPEINKYRNIYNYHELDLEINQRNKEIEYRNKIRVKIITPLVHEQYLTVSILQYL